MPGYRWLLSKNQSGANKVNLLKKIRRSPNENAVYGRHLIFLKKAMGKLKGEWGYRFEFPIVDWAGGEIAIVIHFDAGGILTKTGSMAQIGISGFLANRATDETKNLEPRKCIAVSRAGNKSHAVSTFSCAREVQAFVFMVSTWRWC